MKKEDYLSMIHLLKVLIKKCMLKKHYEQAIQYIKLVSQIYYSTNVLFVDIELEDLLEFIAKENMPQNNYKVNNHRIVLYDYYPNDNKGLSLQYLKGLVSNGYEILYIIEKYEEIKITNILSYVKQNAVIQIIEVPHQKKIIDTALNLREIICEFKPSKALWHMCPWDVIPLLAFYNIDNLSKYQINLTDECFWLGRNFFDYLIEFRNYGYNLSVKYRLVCREKILFLPYYPIIDVGVTDFSYSFPKDKIIVLTGGSMYKIFGDSSIFYKILVHLLNVYPHVLILFVGGGNNRLLRKIIRENKFEKRLLLLGDRNDLHQLYAICDIYLCTYPICGGLMTQLAGIYKKPVLAYNGLCLPDNNIEELFYNLSLGKLHSFSNLNDFYMEAGKLIEDSIYREQLGNLLYKSIVSPKEFTLMMGKLLRNPKVDNYFSDYDIDITPVTNLYIEIEEKYLNTVPQALLLYLRGKALYLFPLFIVKYLLFNYLSFMKKSCGHVFLKWCIWCDKKNKSTLNL